MSLEQVIQANTAAIQALIAQLQAGPVIPFPAKQEPVVEPEPIPEAAPEPTPAEAPVEEPAQEVAQVTRADVQKAIVELSKKQGKPAALAILNSFGANNLPELAEADYGMCLRAINVASAQDSAA